MTAYRILYFLQPEKLMNCGRNLKYSGEELAVAISQFLGALSDSKYIGDTWNFVFKTAPSADNCMSALIILPKVTFKKNLEREDRLFIHKILTVKLVWRKMPPCQYDRYPLSEYKSSVAAVWLLLDIRLYYILGCFLLRHTTLNFPFFRFQKRGLLLIRWLENEDYL